MLSPLLAGGEEIEEFQVNVETAGDQRRPAVAALARGEFVVVWQSTDPTSTVKARKISLDSPQASVESEVPEGFAKFPDVAARPTGGFVVVWDDVFGSNYVINVWGRLYDSDGQPVTQPIRLNDPKPLFAEYSRAKVAVAPDGRFVVTWWDQSHPLPFGDTVYARFFDPLGVPTTEQLTIVAEAASNAWPHATILADGNVLLVWRHNDGGSIDARGRLFNWGGTPRGAEFLLGDGGWNPSAAALPNGGFVATWREDGVRARVFDSEGSPQGSELVVSSSDTFAPRASVLPGGGFTIAWAPTAVVVEEVLARDYDAQGEPLGPEYQVNRFETGTQSNAAIAIDPAGNRLIVWDSNASPGTDSDGESIQGQLMRPILFRDGFESGDTSAWSATVP
jgi:hypothetical protein